MLLCLEGDGAVTVDELYHIMCCLGQKPSWDEVQRICNSDDADGNGCLDYGEFVRLMSRPRACSLSTNLAHAPLPQCETHFWRPDGHPAQRRLKKQLLEFRNCFHLFDKERRGHLNEVEWVEGLHLLGGSMHEPHSDVFSTAFRETATAAVELSIVTWHQLSFTAASTDLGPHVPDQRPHGSSDGRRDDRDPQFIRGLHIRRVREVR